MANLISVDEKLLVQLSRVEIYLLLHLAARADESKTVMIPMREFERATLWNYNKIHSVRRKLIAKGFLEDTPLIEDKTGYQPQKYVITTDRVFVPNALSILVQ